MAKRFEKAKAYTEKYRKELMPCEHCGNTDIRIISDRTIFPPKDGWSVCCMTASCDCTGVFERVKDAVERWNQKQGDANARQ